MRLLIIIYLSIVWVFVRHWYSICNIEGLVQVLIEVRVMLITQQSSNRRLIYSIKQMRSLGNQDIFNSNIERTIIDNNYNEGVFHLLESDESDSYVLGYN
jgi:hypothetical protein